MYVSIHGPLFNPSSSSTVLICYSQTIRRATNCKPQQPYYPRPDGGVRGSAQWKMQLPHHSALGPLLCEEDMVTIQKQHSVWVPGVGLPIDPHGTSASEPHLLSRGNRINCLISYLPTITIDINTSDSKGFCCIISGKKKLWFLTLRYHVPSPKVTFRAPVNQCEAQLCSSDDSNWGSSRRDNNWAPGTGVQVSKLPTQLLSSVSIKASITLKSKINVFQPQTLKYKGSIYFHLRRNWLISKKKYIQN